MRHMCEAASIQPRDLVLEVGAGTGSLSALLLEAGAELVAVEIDRDLEPILRQQLTADDDRLTLLITDILSSKSRLDAQVLQLIRTRPFKLVANLPYQVASPLLINLLLEQQPLTDAVVTIQREVADRWTAPPGTRDYGPLSVLIQAACTVERLAKVSPSCFWPEPTVESTIIWLKRRTMPLARDPKRLANLLHKLFSQRRKQLGTILGRHANLPETIDPTARPETLSVEQLVDLTERLG